MEIALIVLFIVMFILNIVCSIWSTKKNCEEERLRSVAIYSLYKELERYNNNAFEKNKEME